MTERKRVLYSLFLLTLFLGQLVYICTSFSYNQNVKSSTTISMEEEIEEDAPSNSLEEEPESEIPFLTAAPLFSILFYINTWDKPVYRNTQLALFVHLDTPFSPPELMI